MYNQPNMSPNDQQSLPFPFIPKLEHSWLEAQCVIYSVHSRWGGGQNRRFTGQLSMSDDQLYYGEIRINPILVVNVTENI